jgi:hypothetical protein
LVHVSLSRARTRSLAILLALVVVALAAAIATPTAKGGTAPTWYYDEGMPGSAPFSFVAPLDPLLLTIGADQSLAFQVTAAALAERLPSEQNDNQITVSATTSQIDLIMAQGPGTLKDFLMLGGDLSTTVRGVSVKLSCNIDGRTAGGVPQWIFPINGRLGPFTEALPAYAGGHTIAYQVTFTAPATVMTAPVVLDDVVIGYGPYHKPPKSKGTNGGTGHNKDKTGGDKGKPAANTGRGSGSGAGDGSTAGNGSGTSGSGGKQSNSTTPGGGSQTAPVVHKASTKVRSAQAVTDAPVTSPATGGSAVVAGYAVVASAALGASAGEAAAATASAAAGGGRSVGGGTGFGVGDTYLIFGAAIVGLLLLPVPFVARRLRRVAGYDHEAGGAGSGWQADALR